MYIPRFSYIQIRQIAYRINLTSLYFVVLSHCWIWFTNKFFLAFFATVFLVHMCMCVVYMRVVYTQTCRCVYRACLQGWKGDVGCFPLVFFFLLPWDKVSCWRRNITLAGLASLERSQDEWASSPCCWGCRHVQACVAFYRGYLGFKFRFSNLPHKPAYPLSHLPSSSIYSKDVGVCSSVFCGAMIWLCYQQHAGPIRWAHVSVYTFWKRRKSWHYFFLRVRKLCTTDLFPWVDTGLFPLMWVLMDCVF